MAFESLTDKLQNAFKGLKSKGLLTEDDVKAALREVKLALLEADVNFKVVKQFVKSVQERAVGENVLTGLNPAQTVIKIVNEELINLMGSEVIELKLEPGQAMTVIMMCGLNGAGKTTTTAKPASLLKKKGKKCLLVACDVYRNAAIEQLKINAAKVETDVFSMGNSVSPIDIAKASIVHAEKNNYNVVILDTAGRQEIDENLMEELVNIKNEVTVHKTLLVVDGTTGQIAVDVSKGFDEKVGIDGVILTKMDGDERGGAAISIKAVTDKPILFVGMGEKLTDLEPFYPDRMASRILGMGDVLSLIEKATQNIDITEEQSKDTLGRLKKGKFDFEDYLMSMEQMNKMGGLTSILSMMPGLGGGKLKDIDSMIDERQLKRSEAIVLSMTKKERQNPDLLNPQRKHRIAKGAGVDIAEVNRFIKQFEQSRKMMKQMSGSFKKGRKGMPFMPF